MTLKSIYVLLLGESTAPYSEKGMFDKTNVHVSVAFSRLVFDKDREDRRSIFFLFFF